MKTNSLFKKVVSVAVSVAIVGMSVPIMATSGEDGAQTPAEPSSQQQNTVLGSASNNVGKEFGDFIVTTDDGGDPTDADASWSGDANGALLIKSDKSMTISNKNPAISTSNSIYITSASGANLTFAGVNIISAGDKWSVCMLGTISGNVTITLKDDTTNTLKATQDSSAGLEANGLLGTLTGTLTIQGGEKGTGQLIAQGGLLAAGIGGGGLTAPGNNIAISGGIVTATGGDGAAGIGGGIQGNGSNITINGGTVTATGGLAAAGIGGGGGGSAAGAGGDGSNITINGGTVTAIGGVATASYSAAHGIGGGGDSSGSSGNTINGNAVVSAQSGAQSLTALDGFGSGPTKGVVFTGNSTDGYTQGTMYGSSVTLSQDAEFPYPLTVGGGADSQTLTVGNSEEKGNSEAVKNVTLTLKANLTVGANGTLINNVGGTITKDGGTITCNDSGTVKTVVGFTVPTGDPPIANRTYTYQDKDGTKTYIYTSGNASWTGLPEGGYIWKDGENNTVTDDTAVLLNTHTLKGSLDTGDFTVTKGSEGPASSDVSWDEASGVLTIKSDKSMTISNSDSTTPTTDRIVIDSTNGANLTFAGINIVTGSGSSVQVVNTVSGNVTITLEDGTTNILTSTKDGCAGLQNDGIETLTIQGGTVGTGQLTATGGDVGAGIGGGGNLTISGGIVEANGGSRSGSGGDGIYSGGDISISGGTVTATANEGKGIAGSNITISEGTVTATGGGDGEYGIYGVNGITINGGTVIAKAEQSDGYGMVTGSNISITDGTVTATGGDGGCGIVGSSSITINGGIVTANGGEGVADGISGDDIVIEGGTVTANGGGDEGVGISGGSGTIDGNAVVLAKGGGGALQNITLKQGVVFTGDSSGYTQGTMYGDVALSQNITFPYALTVGDTDSQKLTVDSGVTLTLDADLTNGASGTITNNGTITCNGSAAVKTVVGFAVSDGTAVANRTYTYLDKQATALQYGSSEGLPDLPSGYDAWGYETASENSTFTSVDDDSTVLLNTHTLTGQAETYGVEYKDVANEGTVSGDSSATYNAELTVTTNPKDGYEATGVEYSVDGGTNWSSTGVSGSDNSYKFTVPAVTDSNKKLYVRGVFAQTYTVTIPTFAGGSVTADKKENIAPGDEVTLTVDPSDGYQLKDGSLKVTYGGSGEITPELKPGTDNQYTFTMPAADVTVTAEFEQGPSPSPTPTPTPTPTPDDGGGTGGGGTGTGGSGAGGGANATGTSYSSGSAKTGDNAMAGVAGLTALVGLGIAVMLRKRRR